MEQLIFNLTQTLKKIDFMRSQYEKGLSWVSEELKNPTQTEGFSPVEKENKLLQAKNELENALLDLKNQETDLTNKIKELNPVAFEVATLLKDFNL